MQNWWVRLRRRFNKTFDVAHPMASHPKLASAMALIHGQARPSELEGMARFGLTGERRLGLSVPSMRQIAKHVGRDHSLAQALWDTNIPDARIVASLVAEPDKFSSRQMDDWAKGFAAWDVCDQVCLNAFRGSRLAWGKVHAWRQSEREFVRRAAFSLLAVLAVHDKQSGDGPFLAALALMEPAASDNRNFVKKAVNWALRNIGKRNQLLNAVAVETALKIQQQGSKSARWIAADALRELRSEVVQARITRKEY